VSPNEQPERAERFLALDGTVTREEAIASAAAIVEATELPVSADLENGFSESPDGVAKTILSEWPWRPALPGWRTSDRSSTRSSFPSTSWPDPECPRWTSWPAPEEKPVT
jgi:hypothetical protein